MSLVITALQLRQKINNTANLECGCIATVVLQKEDRSPVPQTVKNRVWHKRNCMGSNQLDTQLEVTRGLEACARKMEMSVVQAPTKVIFFFFLSGPFTQTAQSRKRTKTGKEREHETDVSEAVGGWSRLFLALCLSSPMCYSRTLSWDTEQGSMRLMHDHWDFLLEQVQVYWRAKIKG